MDKIAELTTAEAAKHSLRVLETVICPASTYCIVTAGGVYKVAVSVAQREFADPAVLVGLIERRARNAAHSIRVFERGINHAD